VTIAATPIDVGREVAGLRAELEAHADPSYAAGSARTVPSLLPSHAVRVPEIRSVAGAWIRAHRDTAPDDVLRLAEALWATTWREERIVAMQLVAQRRDILNSLAWEVVERWSGEIDNWEHVDHMATAIVSVMLAQRPELLQSVEGLSLSEHSWQRRLSIVTLLIAARRDPAWREALTNITSRLENDRGPTMRKAVVWAKKVLREIEGKNG
jgi:3-methyladenine DNA glycosylase AlkD